ncbi:MAG: hypothetical protein DI603_06795 [Roseateles depolymerans]|uniref:C-type lysozyme inhibitor domain-containing protein n=1 Tax=Roseateles depolymerans TaxID=76731 RepID=A0A2W5DVI0_9BURK|nr:MAG: hypothetical protein DI603_06795 [Roseateles depolymerans]
MKTWTLPALLAALVWSGLAQAQPCDSGRAAWQREVNARLGSADGHGPDLGSEEWQMAVSRQLGLLELPLRGSRTWCERVQQALDLARRAPVCRQRAARGDVEALVCQRAGLALLDARVAEAYEAARRKAVNEHPPVLAAEQRGWQRERHDCWKAGPDPDSASDNEARAACARESSERRLLTLQVNYRLVPVSASARWRCDDGSEVVTHFFNATEPPSLIAERGDERSLMTLQRAASGTHYVGRNESFWEHQGQATVIWGWQGPELRCEKR